MWRLTRGVERSILWGFAIGSGVGIARALELHFPQQHLFRLTLGVWLGALASYLVVGILCGAASQAFRLLEARRSGDGDRRPPMGGRSAAGATAWILSSYPLFFWVALRDGDLLPLSPGLRVLALAALLGIYALLYFTGRRWSDFGKREGPAGAAGAEPSPAFFSAVACLLVVIVAWVLYVRWPSPSGRDGPPPNILLIVLDTVRADRLSLFGYHRPTSPEIDARVPWAPPASNLRVGVFSQASLAPPPGAPCFRRVSQRA